MLHTCISFLIPKFLGFLDLCRTTMAGGTTELCDILPYLPDLLHVEEMMYQRVDWYDGSSTDSLADNVSFGSQLLGYCVVYVNCKICFVFIYVMTLYIVVLFRHRKCSFYHGPCYPSRLWFFSLNLTWMSASIYWRFAFI